jgi:phospholipase C
VVAPYAETGPDAIVNFDVRSPAARTPLLVSAPYSRVNHVDHTVTDQTSVLRFIEPVLLGEATGAVVPR